MKIGFTLLLVVFPFLILVNSQHCKKVVNTLGHEAKYFDISPPIYYIHQGISKGKFIIWFYGEDDFSVLKIFPPRYNQLTNGLRLLETL